MHGYLRTGTNTPGPYAGRTPFDPYFPQQMSNEPKRRIQPADLINKKFAGGGKWQVSPREFEGGAAVRCREEIGREDPLKPQRRNAVSDAAQTSIKTGVNQIS